MADPIVKSIPLSQIVASKHQARKAFDEASLKGLAESMRQEGLIQPVTVRPVGQSYELISGERRLRAAKSLGWTVIEAKVIETSSEAEAAAKGLVENIQREDLNPIEEAEGFGELNRLDPTYWTQAKIAEVCGKSKSHISESFQFLGFPDTIKDEFRRRNLTAGHGVELLRINNANSQKGMASKAVKGQWSVKQLREAIDVFLKKDSSSRTPHAELRTAKKLPEVQWSGKEIVIHRHFRPVEESLAEFMSWLSDTLEPMVSSMPGFKDSPKSVKAMIDASEARADKANAVMQASVDAAFSQMSPSQREAFQKPFINQQPDAAERAEREAMEKKIEFDNNPDNAAAFFAKHLKK
jgi:ParB family chromosome partitioning protein